MMMSIDTTIEFNKGWDIIQNGILKLINILKTDFKDDFPVTEYINIYTTVYKMCTQRPPYMYAQQLYDKYRISLQEYVAHTILPALGKVQDEFLLKELEKCWGNHKVMVRLTSNMFYYLGQNFVRQNSLVSLVKVGVMCFRDVVYHSIKINVKNVVIELINREREGEQIDRALLRNIVNFFVEMGMDRMDLYQKDFEAPMLEDTGAYYSRKGSLWILEEDSCAHYMIKAEECLRREKERVAHYLHPNSEQKLLEKVESEILSRSYIQLLENEYSGCHVLLTNDKKDDLSRMYRLFCRIPQGLEPFANIFEKHVINQGVKWAEDVVKNNADGSHIDDIPALKFVEKIIELHDKCIGYVVDAFQGSGIFYKALRGAFNVICDKKVQESTCAEFLATFCDNVLKKSRFVKKSDHIEGILGKAANLLQYVSDRDLFCEFYRKKLASRLLHHKSANESHERAMLSRIKHQCGLQLTSKMQGMVNDFTLARETQLDFNTYLHDCSNVHPGIELTVTVLNNGFWPTYKLFNLNPPAEILKCIRAYEGFYSTKYQHRKLTWMYCLGNCKIIGNFDTKPIEIAVSTNQAVMLLLFNDFERLSCEEISSQLNLPEEDVIRLLRSFVCGKYKIILKEPVTRTITKTDNFGFNASFTCKSARIKISLPQMDEKKRVSEVVDGDRCDAIDAVIVRTMKARKVLSSQELFVECVEQLQATFKPKVNLMQKQIEDLISREFIERDKENSNIIRYVA